MLALYPKQTTSISITFHVDTDCFFASVEVGEIPEFKRLPVVVGSNPKGGSGRRSSGHVLI